MPCFRFGHAAASDWKEAADACLDQIGPVPAEANLGSLYLTDLLARHVSELLTYLRAATGIQDWVGSQGLGLCATGVEYYDRPALALMLGEFPADSFRVFEIPDGDFDAFEARHGDWMRQHPPYLGLVHADPSQSGTEALIQRLAQRTTAGFLVGGFASARGAMESIANDLTSAALSGVLFTELVGVATALTQGCSPIGPLHCVTECQRNILVRLDDAPAFEVLRHDIGEEQARDLGRLGGAIFAGLPVAGSDSGDYLVRSLVGVDPNQGLVAIGEWVDKGQSILFCKRDAETAREDLIRMLTSLKRRLSGPPRGGIYVSCLGRGVNLLGPDSAELRHIQQILGDFPLVGFYANGEISRDRLYGYTGVLTLFT